jgi:hypothetical protein
LKSRRWLFRDRTLHGLEVLLDEAFVLPGTGMRFGLGGIIGLVSGLGDEVGLASRQYGVNKPASVTVLTDGDAGLRGHSPASGNTC